MTNNNAEETRQERSRRIILTEKEVSEISKLYEIAINLSEKRSSSLSLSNNNFQRQDDDSFKTRPTFDQDDNFLKTTSLEKRKKAWHDVQEYLERLGRKYNYDPEKFVINKITRELEPYSPK
ncbi:hypothetical protein [Candidatus Nitrosocosmicus franklandus]|uniref:Uncharacterized protein n=1 Tax=Candidatus Nitrosocosmicus franklandianus TaxID=1798806 RepID=A0A484I4F7_9ARCH|nr:hypothetical protein [Candidatus Nitrosocosmicus franklandus]VFJ12545.1 conserved protein of unknown function [Candidatus Nitrosocosmicus franklandus]